jgi:SAM-dependent methyltransferase
LPRRILIFRRRGAAFLTGADRRPIKLGVTSTPLIFDKALQRARLRRALRGRPVAFLFERALADLEDRLSSVNRDFRAALDFGAPLPDVTRALARRFPAADVTRAAPDRCALGEGAFRGLVADDECAPFAPESFDLIVSLLAMQSTNDLPGALTHMRLLLRPDGLFLGCLVGGRTLQELRRVLALVEEEAFGGASPRVSPFVDLRDLGGLLQRAGFALPVTDVDQVTVRYDDLFALIRDLRGMGAAAALVERSRRPLTRTFWRCVAERYAAMFADADGRVRATFELVWLSGWAPHDSQQKPLPPGSARMRLADALGSAEGKLPR